MNIVDRVFGRKLDLPTERLDGVTREDGAAVARYERLVASSSSRTIQRVHVEAFEKLTPAQLDLLFERFTAEATPGGDALPTRGRKAWRRPPPGSKNVAPVRSGGSSQTRMIRWSQQWWAIPSWTPLLTSRSRRPCGRRSTMGPGSAGGSMKAIGGDQPAGLLRPRAPWCAESDAVWWKADTSTSRHYGRSGGVATS